MTVINTNTSSDSIHSKFKTNFIAFIDTKTLFPAEEENERRQQEMEGTEWGVCVCVCVCTCVYVCVCEFEGVCFYLERPQRTAGLRRRQPWPDTALTSCLAPGGSATHQPVWEQRDGWWGHKCVFKKRSQCNLHAGARVFVLCGNINNCCRKRSFHLELVSGRKDPLHNSCHTLMPPATLRWPFNTFSYELEL